MPSPVVQLRVPAEVLARVDEARGGGSMSAWVRDAIVRKLGGSLDPSPEEAVRSPVVEYDSHEAHGEEHVDFELERRRKIAATHAAGCKCLNCTMTR